MLEVGKDVEPPEEEPRGDAAGSDCSVAGILRLVGSEPSAQMLMELGKGPLRTRQLTDRIEDCSARSVYRRAGDMEACGLICREREPGVPSKVVLSLTEPAGRELFRLLRAFAATSMDPLPGESGPALPWARLNLLGELWKLGMLEELSYEPRSLAQFSRGDHELTFHQVSRRVSLFIADGLLTVAPSEGMAKRYELTHLGRRCMTLVAGIGRWRRHLPGDEPGLTIDEMATVLRAAMSLTRLPEHMGKNLELRVAGPADAAGNREVQTLQGTVDIDGTLRYTANASESAEGSAGATINTWFAALLDGNRGRIRVRGEQALVDSFMTQLYDVLWGKVTLPSTVASDG